MLANEFTIRDDFPAVTYDEWRKLAEADLNGATFEQRLVTHTYEGIDIRPVYTPADHPSAADPDGFPGFSPMIRGGNPLGSSQTGWDLRQEHAHPDIAVTNQAILDDLRGGVTSLLLRFDLAARNGLDADQPAAADLAGRDGVMIYTLDDLDQALKGVYLQMIAVTLEAGAAFVPAAALLAALWRKRGVTFGEARGAFNADPLAVLVRDGQLPMAVDEALLQLADLAAWTSANCPQVTSVRVGTAPYHHAGATAAQDVAFSMATAVTYLRAMTQRGLTAEQAARQILFSISLGTHHFLAIAKLRAVRGMWAGVLDTCGVSPASAPMRMHARTSKRVLTHRDPYVNLLRNSAALFAAGLGGADAITSVPFDAAIGLPDAFSRRIARNTLLVLQEEANLHRVVDPAGGSWYLDWLTDQIAEKGWKIFQEIESHGGMVSAIRSGWIAEHIDNAFGPRAKNLARRKDGITGISEFPNLGEQPVSHPAIDLAALRADAKARLASRGRMSGPTLTSEDRIEAAINSARNRASIASLAAGVRMYDETVQVPPLTPHPFAEPFEDLRDASDQYAAAHNGQRPRVFLASMGSAAHYTTRTTYAKNFFEAGGFEVISKEGFRDAEEAARRQGESGAKIAVICSSDKLYPEIVPQLAPKLKAAGARTVVLAGNPGANEAPWRAAGVDRFIFMKCDVLATLQEMLREAGVPQL
jgi:methylmalonyl-CoA mutase